MLREKFWLQLKLETTETFDLSLVWVEAKISLAAWEILASTQTRDNRNLWFVRHDCERKSRQIQVSSKEDNYKLKLYDEGATPSVEKVVRILSLTAAIQKWKTAEIESVTPQGNR